MLQEALQETLVVWYPQSQEAQEFLQIYITMRQNQASRAVTSLHTSSGPLLYLLSQLLIPFSIAFTKISGQAKPQR